MRQFWKSSCKAFLHVSIPNSLGLALELTRALSSAIILVLPCCRGVVVALAVWLYDINLVHIKSIAMKRKLLDLDAEIAALEAAGKDEDSSDSNSDSDSNSESESDTFTNKNSDQMRILKKASSGIVETVDKKGEVIILKSSLSGEKGTNANRTFKYSMPIQIVVH